MSWQELYQKPLGKNEYQNNADLLERTSKLNFE